MDSSFVVIDPQGGIWCNIYNEKYFSNISKAKKAWGAAHWDHEKHKLLDFDKDAYPSGWRIAKVEPRIVQVFGLPS